MEGNSGTKCERISDDGRFYELAGQFSALDVDAAAVDANLLNLLLDQLNSLRYSDGLFQDSNLCERLLLAGINLIASSTSDHLMTKFSPLIVNLLKRQKLEIMSNHLLIALLDYHAMTLTRCAVWVRPYILNSLSAILGHSSMTNSKETVSAELLNDLVSFADEKNDDLEARRCSLKCLENLTLRLQSSDNLMKEQTRRLLRLFLGNLRASRSTTSPTMDAIVNCKILVSSLIGMRNLVIVSRLSDISVLGELLAVLKGLMFYSLPGYSNLPLVDCLYPSPLSQSYLADVVKSNRQPSSPGPPKNRKAKRKSAKRSNNRPVNDQRKVDNYQSWVPRSGASSSESEYSDTDVNSGNSDVIRIKALQSRVRSSSIGTLSALFQVVNRKVLFGYWSSFLPSDDIAGSSTAAHGTLISVFLKDPTLKVRSGALGLLTTMLDGSKPFLALADDRNRGKSSSFITLSQTLASMIRGVQRAIILALVSETSPLVLTQAIHCIAAFINVVPVDRLAPDFLAKFINHLKQFLDNRDANVRVAVLTAFGAIVAVESSINEVTELLVDGSSCWLIDICVANLHEKTIPLPVRIESLQLLTVLAKFHFRLIWDRLLVVVGVIESGLLDVVNESLQLHSAKLLEEFGRSFAKFTPDDLLPFENKVLDIWCLLLGTCLPQVPPENTILLAKLCDCLSTLTAEMFSSLPKHNQLFCKTILLGLSRDEDRGVTAAAIRALGLLVFHPVNREDCEFLADVLNVVIDAIMMGDCRIKAAWALANVTDALVINRRDSVQSIDGELFLKEVIDDDLLSRLCLAALHGTMQTTSVDSNDRVRSNAVRALGNLLRYFGPEHLEKSEFVELVRRSIESLEKSASVGSNMKVRWNACYALGNAFGNRQLLLSVCPSDVFLTLSNIAKECKNFKVRINAAAALIVPDDRQAYGQQSIATLVTNLLIALDNIPVHMDFVEYQHKDNLIEQVCASICHLISLVLLSDVGTVSEVVQTHGELLRGHLDRCIARQSTEFTPIYYRANARLTALKSGNNSEPILKLENAIAVTRPSSIVGSINDYSLSLLPLPISDS